MTDRTRAHEFDDPDFMVFVGDVTRLPGVAEDHGAVDAFRGMFTRRTVDLEEEWGKVSAQVQRLLAATKDIAGPFEMQEVTVELGFSAEGELCFIAKAGVSASVSATFKRREAQSGGAD